MKKVIYDGSCKLCRITIDKARKADAGKTLEFVDFTSQPLPPGMDRAAAEKFAANDPYRKAGLFQSVNITGWRKAYPKS